ncbi:CoA-binding protein [Rhizosaccharibacter radicis]|uniref:CoA-binding protein n=1 Tax=Rhizosaccharibacter radicis TaxID=2782605 RepID=A0ABT1VVY0_9PROT|nr:CoA-binding protein [Acetobacteraceae bacterium KSS12]
MSSEHGLSGRSDPVDGLDDAEIAALLRRTRRIAVVGASGKPERASFGVMRFLLGHGFEVVPVNPGLAGQRIHGQPVVASLEEAVRTTGGLDMVDVFRRSEEAGAVIDEAVRLGAKAVWLQLGVVAPEAAERARAAGVTVVMDRCPAIEIPRLGIEQVEPG